MAVFLSFILVLSAVLGQIPANTRAAEDGYGISNPVMDSNGVTTWDCIWFGNYWQEDTNDDGVANQKDEKMPIKWRVLSIDGDDAFLLADQVLDCQWYHSVECDITWEMCRLRKWLNDTFYMDAFNSEEQSAIQTTTVINEDNPDFGTKGGNDTSDKVYLLSISEASNAAYGFNSVYHESGGTRASKNTSYAKAKEAYTNSYYFDNGIWWLRSPGGDSNMATVVEVDGRYSSCILRNTKIGVRPVVHINLSSSVWEKAEKVDSSGGIIENETPVSPYGIRNPVIDSHGVTTWDCIWFGNYWQSNEEAKEPIKWRVLSVDGNDAFLLADQGLDCQSYNAESETVTWETCSLRKWLNDVFYTDAFSLEEQLAIQTTTVVNMEELETVKNSNDTNDKVFLLSVTDVRNGGYGLGSDRGISKNTKYAEKKGAYTNNGNGIWWLRSLTRGKENSAVVASYAGFDCAPSKGSVNNDNYVVRPALHLDLSTSVWKKAGRLNSRGDIKDEGSLVSPPLKTETPILTVAPTQKPTPIPTVAPTQKPTSVPTVAPTWKPTSVPMVTPTQKPTLAPVVTTTPHVIETPAPTPDMSSTAYGISNPVIKDGATTWDCIWFGNYWQNDSDGKTKEPIKWRVLSVDGDDAFLLADQSLDCQPYDQRSSYTQKSYPWETCSLRTWLNDAFYKNAFNSAEQSAIRSTLVINEEGTKGGNNTQDKLYLLSVKEAGNTTYGFNNKAGGMFGILDLDATRYSKNTRYANRKGAFTYSSGNGSWWLRTPGQNSCAETVVDSNGAVSSGGDGVAVTSNGVRPVLHLDLSSSVWKRAGKVSSVSSSQGTAKPTPAATQTPVVSSTDYGISNPVVKDGVTTWDCIWFGNYWQSNGKTKEPIKWRVLSVDGDDALLLADQNLDCQPYNIVNTSITWEACWLRTWLNSTFYLDAFNLAEQSAIRETLVINGRNPFYDTGGGRDTRDNVYLLSIDEARNEAYGFTSEYTRENGTRCSKNTQYAKEQGAYTINTGNGWWWLRSPGNDSSSAADVSDYGWGVNSANDVNIGNIAVRPVLHINLSSSVWKKAGKVDSAADISETDTPVLHPAETVKPTDYGIRNPVEKDGVNTWDCVWFGNYWQSDKETKEPIKWRVLSVDGDDAFLLADQNLDCQPYDPILKGGSLSWENCSLRAWLNSDFYQNAFDSAEQSAIQRTLVVNKDDPAYGTKSGSDTSDKIYILSITEASNAAYGFAPDGRRDAAKCTKNTEYAMWQSSYMLSEYKSKVSRPWWLRSPSSHQLHAATVWNDGRNDATGYVANSRYNGVRPVLHINLSSNTWSKAGTVSSSGNIKEISAPTPKEETSSDAEPRAVKSAPVKTILKDSTGTTYTVTSSGSSKSEVAYTAPKNKKVTSVAIPDAVQLNGTTYKVTSIKANAFKKCKKLKKVTIGKNINAIGKNAFYQCTKLKSITIKTTKLANKSIGNKAFAKLNKKVKIKVPKKKLSAYKKLLKKKGVTGKKQVIKK